MVMQIEVLMELFHTHVGIVKMKQLAKKFCYWKQKIRTLNILQIVLLLKNHTETKASLQRVSGQWFERIHVDYVGPVNGKFFLVLVVAKSKWPVICVNNEAPTSESTI